MRTPQNLDELAAALEWTRAETRSDLMRVRAEILTAVQRALESATPRESKTSTIHDECQCLQTAASIEVVATQLRQLSRAVQILSTERFAREGWLVASVPPTELRLE